MVDCFIIIDLNCVEKYLTPNVLYKLLITSISDLSNLTFNIYLIFQNKMFLSPLILQNYFAPYTYKKIKIWLKKKLQ